MDALRNHVEKARPNAAGSTPARPFPDTGSRGSKNAFDEHPQKLALANPIDELRRDRNRLYR